MPKVFVGRVSNRVSDQDLKDMFSKYGTVSHVHMKQNFAFVHFDNQAEAEEAIKALDGYRVAGESLVVELAKSEYDPGAATGVGSGAATGTGAVPNRRPPFRPRFDDKEGGAPFERHASRFRDDANIVPPPHQRATDGTHSSGGRYDENRGDRSYYDGLRMDREPRPARYDREDRYQQPYSRTYSPAPWREGRPNYEYAAGDRRPRDYPRNDNYYRRDDQMRRPVGCFQCGNPDHKAAYCPERRNSPRRRYDMGSPGRKGGNRSHSPANYGSYRYGQQQMTYGSSSRSPVSSGNTDQQTSGASETAPWNSEQQKYQDAAGQPSESTHEALRSPSPVAQFYEDS